MHSAEVQIVVCASLNKSAEATPGVFYRRWQCQQDGGSVS